MLRMSTAPPLTCDIRLTSIMPVLNHLVSINNHVNAPQCRGGKHLLIQLSHVGKTSEAKKYSLVDEFTVLLSMR